MEDLRVALFAGNYNYMRDGASLTLNRLVDYLERQNIEEAFNGNNFTMTVF